MPKILDFALGGYNTHSGPLPSELGYLSTIRNMHLLDCGFTGTLPTELANIKWQNVEDAVPRLMLTGNQLTGTIPFLGTLSRIHLQSNKLTGTFPMEYADWSTQGTSQQEMHLRHFL